MATEKKCIPKKSRVENEMSRRKRNGLVLINFIVPLALRDHVDTYCRDHQIGGGKTELIKSLLIAKTKFKA